MNTIYTLGEYEMVYQKLLPHGQRLQMSIHICYALLGWARDAIQKERKNTGKTTTNQTNHTKAENALFMRFRKAKTMMRPSHKMYAMYAKRHEKRTPNYHIT